MLPLFFRADIFISFTDLLNSSSFSDLSLSLLISTYRIFLLLGALLKAALIKSSSPFEPPMIPSKTYLLRLM